MSVNLIQTATVESSSPETDIDLAIDIGFWTIFVVGVALIINEFGKCLSWWDDIFK